MCIYKQKINANQITCRSKFEVNNMKAVLALFVVVALIGGSFAADDDDHSNHCHIDDYPTIHIDIGKSIDLPGACLKLFCKNTDLFEVVNTCTYSNDLERDSFADKLVKGNVCT